MVTSRLAYAGFLLLLYGERLVELRLSRRNAQRVRRQGAVEVGDRHFRCMAVMHALFPLACAAEVYGLGRPFTKTLGYAALAVALLAQGLRYWAIATLGER